MSAPVTSSSATIAEFANARQPETRQGAYYDCRYRDCAACGWSSGVDGVDNPFYGGRFSYHAALCGKHRGWAGVRVQSGRARDGHDHAAVHAVSGALRVAASGRRLLRQNGQHSCGWPDLLAAGPPARPQADWPACCRPVRGPAVRAGQHGHQHQHRRHGNRAGDVRGTGGNHGVLAVWQHSRPVPACPPCCFCCAWIPCCCPPAC